MTGSYQLTFIIDDIEHSAEIDTQSDLLALAEREGFIIRRACRNGVCGLCRCRLKQGQIDYRGRQPHGLWDEDLTAGLILPCIAYATTDIVLDQLLLESED